MSETVTVQNPPLHWSQIHGWFDFEALYDQMVERATNGDEFLEVGAWLGKSAVYLASRIRESGKDIKITVVDYCRPSLDDPDYGPITRKLGGNTAGQLLHHMVLAGVADLISIVVAPSLRAAELLSGKRFQFIFIDADHSEDAVFNDITAYSQLLKEGGVIGGHDYFHYPSVRAAVNRFYGAKELEKQCPVSLSCWYHDTQAPSR